MDSFLQVTAPLVGVVVGALLAGLVQRSNADRATATARAEDRRAERRDSYAEFLAAAATLHHRYVAFFVAEESDRSDAQDLKLKGEDSLGPLASAQARLTLLSSSAAVVDAASRVSDALMDLMSADQESLRVEATHDYHAARTELLEAAQQDLDVVA